MVAHQEGAVKHAGLVTRMSASAMTIRRNVITLQQAVE
jgi:DeoR/GlpR family transcriptional regulator of sugar metabolism